jgi:glycosyltransferase involved in cell wall biosynthesis
MSRALPRTLFVGPPAVVAHYRVILPATALGADWLTVGPRGADWKQARVSAAVVQDPVPADFRDITGYETVILQRPHEPYWAGAVERFKARGARVLIELDDDLHAVRSEARHEIRDQYDAAAMRRLERNLRAADGLIVSTPHLAARYAELAGGPVWVCENGLDLDRYDHERPDLPGVWIGWAGAQGHQDAVETWAPAVCAVLRARPQTRLVSVGLPFAAQVAAALAVQDRPRCLALPPANLQAYPASLALADLALAPAVDTPLFRGKSDLRWLEASALGIPTVAHPLVYRRVRDGETGLLASTAQEAEAAILRLVDDADERARIGAAAQAEVRRERAFPAAATPWTTALTDR